MEYSRSLGWHPITSLRKIFSFKYLHIVLLWLGFICYQRVFSGLYFREFSLQIFVLLGWLQDGFTFCSFGGQKVPLPNRHRPFVDSVVGPGAAGSWLCLAGWQTNQPHAEQSIRPAYVSRGVVILHNQEQLVGSVVTSSRWLWSAGRWTSRSIVHNWLGRKKQPHLVWVTSHCIHLMARNPLSSLVQHHLQPILMAGVYHHRGSVIHMAGRHILVRVCAYLLSRLVVTT